MQVVVAVVNAVVMAVVGLVLWWALRGRFEALERRFDRIEAEMAALCSDLTMVALAVGAKPRAGNA